ncbi:hypothetical protein niasHT_036494 [Heterodera trifolii]|uniref:Uncharacterized protein n=1 Tax=Heterodera trifolii TaxID=157864 RepID=A0ABD2IWA0_9BILA
MAKAKKEWFEQEMAKPTETYWQLESLDNMPAKTAKMPFVSSATAHHATYEGAGGGGERETAEGRKGMGPMDGGGNAINGMRKTGGGRGKRMGPEGRR